MPATGFSAFEMKSPEHLLMVADSEHDANMLYAVGMFVPDPFIFLRTRGRDYIVMSDLEIDRSRKQAPHCCVLPLSRYQQKLRRDGIKRPGSAEVIPALLRERGIRSVVVPQDFPYGLATDLQRQGIRVIPRPGNYFPQRENKSAAEVRMLSAALLMAEIGMSEAMQVLRRAKIGKGRRLLHHDVPLTSEKLRAVIDTAILQAGGLAAHTIVSGGKQGCDPHEEGYGPLRAHEPIILDIFPRSQKTGYFGDITRTVVRGRASEAVRKLYDTVLQGQKLAFQKMRVLSRRERQKLVADGPEGAVLQGGWQRWANYVARSPRRLSVLALLAIALLSIPILSLHLGLSDQSSDPAGSTTRAAYDQIAQGFGPGFNGPLFVVGSIHNAADRATMQKLDVYLHAKPGIKTVSPVGYSPDGTVALISVVATTSPQDTKTSQLITTLRDSYIPDVTSSSHTQIYVGGQTALSNDFSNVLDSKILGVIVVLGCLLLMVAFRSVLIPLTAALMNLLAVVASFGLVVAVFQWGWGSAIIGSGTGPIESFLPIIMIAILFGLSMDYQVFLVSRMHEEWVNTGDNEGAIIHGQANTGRVISAAALIMICVFLAFAVGGERIIAEFGIGLGGAVLIDALVLRTVLVPALMHFFGKANWWMPKWLDRAVPHLAVEAAENTTAV